MRIRHEEVERKADAILAADTHLREDQPVCRTDDYQAAQDRKIGFIRDLQQRHAVAGFRPPVLSSGDLFDHWKPSPNLIRWAIESLPEIIVTPGQHDLPNHSFDLLDRSGLGVLRAASRAHVVGRQLAVLCRSTFWVSGFPWGAQLVQNDLKEIPEKKVALIHALVSDKELWPGMKVLTPDMVMDALPGYDLIVTGDNHRPFVHKRGRQVLVNPGSMMRMTADQADMRPRVYLWYAETNEIEAVYLPIDRDVVTRDHIERGKDKDERLAAFVSRLKEGVEIGLSFDRNLEAFFAKHGTPDQVRKIIYDAMEAR